eukprot:4266303-Prymnesium_polylepis.1
MAEAVAASPARSSQATVLLAIMTSSRTLPALLSEAADGSRRHQTAATACARAASLDIVCVGYTDTEDVPTLGIGRQLRLVRPSEYIRDGFEAPADCCNFSDRAQTPRKLD